MIFKVFFCLLLVGSISPYKIHNGIHIRATGQLTHDELLEIDLYLRRYGYLDDHMPGTRTLATTEDRKYALQYFQNFNHIPITGEYDDDTAALFAKERCGCPDVMPQKNEAEDSSKENPPKPVQFNLGTKWNKNSITWRLNSFSIKINQRDVTSETRRAFDLWSKAANLQFTERPSGDVDILIDFARGFHNDGQQNSFDGEGRVLAHAFFPPFGDTHFDDDERWVVNRTGTDYFTVAAHEFGHALGLAHSEIRQALMAPFYTGYNPNFELHSDDIAGIRALYGAPVNEPPPPTRPLPTQRPPVTQPPTPPPTNRPNICNARFNAVIRDFNGDLLAFVGRALLLRLNPNGGFLGSMSQRRTYISSPRRPDAAFEVFSASRVMIMKGRRLYEFNRAGRLVDIDWITGGGATMPEQPRAALAFSANDVSVFGLSQVWKMNPNTGEVVSGSHRYISDEYPGIPNGPDAAVIRDSGTILFFKDNNMYTFDRSANRVSRTDDKMSVLMPISCRLP